jgi:hypothetical protein
MRASRRVLAVALVCLASFCLSSFAAAQQSDEVVAESVLGPRWKQLSRRAGMIFAGTVLTAAAPTGANDRTAPGATAAVELRFRVDEAIAGVERGQVLTIHEWAGAWSMHRPMASGQHTLIFLYPPSRLGLTSPVGGALGQVALDPSGKNVAERKPALALGLRSEGLRNESSRQPRVPGGARNVSVVQLERAIRRAREE